MVGLTTTTRLGCALALAISLALAGCGGKGRVRAGDAAGAPAREVLFEVLPRSAELRLDGRPLGRGGGAVPAPPSGEHVLAVTADGYEPVERALPEGDLAGARIAAALRPLGFASARALDYDDADGLALAAAFLAAAGAPADAAEYAERALVLEPGTPLAHRVVGDAAASHGDLRRAITAWGEYLRLAPDAPDAAQVAARLDDAREATPR